MKSAPAIITKNKKLIASDAWQEPIRPETQKHRRFIWATQFGTGRGGAGPTGRKAKPARLLKRALAERPGVNTIVRERQAAQRAAKLNPPRVIQGLLGPA